MIIKEKLPRSEEAAVSELEAILQQNLTNKKRKLVEKELFALKKGQRGEKEAAYLINFDFGNSENWAVLHDVRLRADGLVAQIDHLIINRLLDIYVLESKNFTNGIKINDDGEFLVYYNQSYQAIPSPIEQNRRHIRVLEDCLQDHDIMPKRLGFSIKPNFRSFILMSPRSRVFRPKQEVFDTSMVIKADNLRTTVDNVVDKMGVMENFTTVSKICNTNTLREVAQKIAALHEPSKIDYGKRFGLTSRQALTEKEKPASREAKKPRYYCWECKNDVNLVVAEYCWSYKHIYKNKVYCKKCQKSFLQKTKGRGV